MAPAPKHKRRKPNTGTIRYKPGRDRPYEAEFPLGRGYKPRYEAFRSYAEAETFLDTLVKERDDPELPRNIAGGSMLLQDYLNIWLDLRRSKVAPKTFESYQYYCEVACGEGGIGRLRLDRVDPLTAQRTIDALAKSGFKNVAQLSGVLKRACAYAVNPLGYLKRNPFAEIELPEVERRSAQALSTAERERMLDQLAWDDATPYRTGGPLLPPLLPLWHLYSRLALRRGEGLALRWYVVDLEAALLIVAASRGRVGTAHIEGKTKGKYARTIPLPGDIVDLLRAHKAAQMRAALANGWRWTDQSYVFCDDQGEPLKVDAVRTRWERIRARARLPETIRIHDLRHTALTILALAGVPENVRMALGGHRTEQMAKHYADHASIEDIRKFVG